MNERSNHSESRSLSDPGASRQQTQCPLNTVSPGKFLDGPTPLYRETELPRKEEIAGTGIYARNLTPSVEGRETIALSSSNYLVAWRVAAVTGSVTWRRLPL